MSFDRRLGLSGLIVGLVGISAFYLWPDKRWIGWACLLAAVVLVLVWFVLELRKSEEEPIPSLSDALGISPREGETTALAPRDAHQNQPEDRSSWPDVVLECVWPSLLMEPQISGSHTLRRRPWMLRYRGLGAVYNVRISNIDFGAYDALFPFSVPTLTDHASIYPVIRQKSDGRVIAGHDLESLLHNPPADCDVQRYAVKISGNEEQMQGFISEVEIPVRVSYDDKNGNRFRIEYLLHYDMFSEKGTMIRRGGIEKVVDGYSEQSSL
jgi:hypothetical protein